MEDMVETMKKADGVGIAAPQVGIMKRFFIAMPHVDSEDEEQRDKIYYMINPEITYKEGTQDSSEGCLSVPGYMGLVERPQKIRIKAQDLDGKSTNMSLKTLQLPYSVMNTIIWTGYSIRMWPRRMMTSEEYAERLEAVKAEERRRKRMNEE